MTFRKNSSDSPASLASTVFDPVQAEVWRHLFASIAEEMGATLERTAYSPNIKERLDHSCALFDQKGRLLAQAAHIPVHLGAMPLMMTAMIEIVSWEPGMMILCNDPRIGGTHLPDLTLVAPVFMNFDTSGEEELVGFVASRAHHADIGGLSAGSLPLSTELFHEGLILPPVKLVQNGMLIEDIVSIVCANSRTPSERRGDLSAQVAANETGVRRFKGLVQRYGYAEFLTRSSESVSYSERAVLNLIESLPPGVYSGEDFLDDDGFGSCNIPIRLKLTIRHTDNPDESEPVDASNERSVGSASLTFDFSGSSPQVKGSLNATEAITRSACQYVVRCLIEEEIPMNAGCFLPLAVIVEEGSVLNARFPAAVAGGNVETSQRVVDTILRAFAKILPGKIPALSQGTMNNITIGGYDLVRGRPFAYYETLGGGAGGSSSSPGASGIHTHMTNTRNTPVEVFETHYPMRVLEYSIAEGTGGEGEHRGGDGLIRRVELLNDAQISILTERRASSPSGISGGGDGAPGKNTLSIIVDAHATTEYVMSELPAKWSDHVSEGSILSVRTPGGGGWGEI